MDPVTTTYLTESWPYTHTRAQDLAQWSVTLAIVEKQTLKTMVGNIELFQVLRACDILVILTIVQS